MKRKPLLGHNEFQGLPAPLRNGLDEIHTRVQGVQVMLKRGVVQAVEIVGIELVAHEVVYADISPRAFHQSHMNLTH